MKKLMKLVILGCFCLLSACGYANLDDVKSAAPAKWEKMGYVVKDYEGYQWGLWFGGSYGGAKVWHQLRRNPDNGVTYTGYIKKWGNEYHVYGPQAIDAIQPK